MDYSVVDSQGGKATVTQTVIVKGDGETSDLKPTLTVPIATTITVGESFDSMAKVKAIDKEDGDLTSKVKVEEVDTSKVGTYIVTYTVTNSKEP